MTNLERRIRKWFRSKGWHTRSGNSYAEALLFNKEDFSVAVEIDPVILPNKVLIYIGGHSHLFTIKELKMLCELAENNNEDLKNLRKSKNAR